MKLLKKIGLIFTSFVLIIKKMIAKVYATAIDNVMIYNQTAYGVLTKPEPLKVVQIVSKIVIPIILLIGLVVFLVKSTKSVTKKVMVSIGIVIIYITFRMIIK